MADDISEYDFTYSFPAIRGMQAGREYYVAMMRFRHVVALLRLSGGDDLPKRRAQRALNRGRLPALANYLLNNPKSYVFSSLTASVGGRVLFEPLGDGAVKNKLGVLRISADAPIVINDGQHRRAAIERAIEKNLAMANDCVSVVLFVDAGLERSQQVFADLNRFAVRPTKSLTILYDHRDRFGRLVAAVVNQVSVFNGMTEFARTTISNRSRKLFTLSSIYQATRRLLKKDSGSDLSIEDERLAVEFWTHVASYIPAWGGAVAGKVNPYELRQNFVHAHGLALQSLAIAGTDLIRHYPSSWKTRLKRLSKIDWSRSNTELWEGRALHQGRVSKAQSSVLATADLIRKTLGIRADTSKTGS